MAFLLKEERIPKKELEVIKKLIDENLREPGDFSRENVAHSQGDQSLFRQV